MSTGNISGPNSIIPIMVLHLQLLDLLLCPFQGRWGVSMMTPMSWTYFGFAADRFEAIVKDPFNSFLHRLVKNVGQGRDDGKTKLRTFGQQGHG